MTVGVTLRDGNVTKCDDWPAYKRTHTISTHIIPSQMKIDQFDSASAVWLNPVRVRFALTSRLGVYTFSPRGMSERALQPYFETSKFITYRGIEK